MPSRYWDSFASTSRQKSDMNFTHTMRKALPEAIGGLDQWAQRCHECSLALIRTGLLPDDARVARGWCGSISSQHSWVVIGNPYDENAPVLDGTLWSYTDQKPRLFFCPKGNLQYQPHGAGSIWEYGRPDAPVDEVITLKTKLSKTAADFLTMAAPNGLDYLGWSVLAHAPVGGWPAREIISAMYDDERLGPLIPIDIVGMLTDKNPGGLYW